MSRSTPTRIGQAKLKHRKAGEFREVPLPCSAREVMERYEEKHGTTKDGCLLRGPSGCYTEPMERRRVQRLFKDLPAEDGVGMYSFRHYFASNALGNGIPITDVAEWMGHNRAASPRPPDWSGKGSDLGQYQLAQCAAGRGLLGPAP
ncbi:tyrosine-type recombinase/integrase [Streptomyces mirabilis]|uniref:tyrosine-type recombinase/integrase n=1 Tax=Streptomyces mirabilis TaxID=68239 RepID=UPI0036B9D66B